MMLLVAQILALNGRMVRIMTDWKGGGRKQLWANLRCSCGTCIEELRKPQKTTMIPVSGELNPGPNR
jgi:hypothetical protein